VAGRFRLYTDADVDGRVVKALVQAGWDIERGIDAYPERSLDPVHFEHAVSAGRVLVSNDSDMKLHAESWAAEVAGKDRFSQDSFLGNVDNPPSLHRYFYANDNPVRYWDPTGHIFRQIVDDWIKKDQLRGAAPPGQAGRPEARRQDLEPLRLRLRCHRPRIPRRGEGRLHR
jgi:hypothetical protein